ncbi:hypothetical protein ANCCAN_08765 [Ancylostoma caninum]|uniref:CC domain-containing protein n=1 Tax=Ancylostoma caninum TaxID=29170 RepID=A0A368GQG7_ANCCA|nr:hypothetical protein ANCCAN_08765 [Ancylostoma caninum]
MDAAAQSPRLLLLQIAAKHAPVWQPPDPVRMGDALRASALSQTTVVNARLSEVQGDAIAKVYYFVNQMGICLGGFTCNNGFCWQQCPSNVMLFGAYLNTACVGGRTCQAGNICC